MVSTEASWWNILNLKKTLGYIVSLILLNLGHVSLLHRQPYVHTADNAKQYNHAMPVTNPRRNKTSGCPFSNDTNPTFLPAPQRPWRQIKIRK